VNVPERKQLLFVCSRNQWRSPTAEALFDDSDQYDARSAGTSDRARVKVTAGLIGWADEVFVMERKHADQLKRKYADALSGKAIRVLHIPDDYQFMDPALIEVLQEKLADYLT
jgi:predicted protein tyrosine phosphatase